FGGAESRARIEPQPFRNSAWGSEYEGRGDGLVNHVGPRRPHYRGLRLRAREAGFPQRRPGSAGPQLGWVERRDRSGACPRPPRQRALARRAARESVSYLSLVLLIVP